MMSCALCQVVWRTPERLSPTDVKDTPESLCRSYAPLIVKEIYSDANFKANGGIIAVLE